MFRLRLFLIVAILLCLKGPHAGAEPVLSVDLSSKNPHADETVIYTLQIKWPRQEGEYSFAIPDLNLTGLKTVRRGESQEILIRQQQEWVVKKFIFQLKAAAPGPAAVNAFTITYVQTEQGLPGMLDVGRLDLTVLKAPFRPARLHYIAAGTLAGALFGLLFAIKGRRRRLKNEQEASKILSKEDVILSRLNQVMETQPQRPPRDVLYDLGKEFHLFLNDYYQVNAKGSSQNEVRSELQKQGLSTQEADFILGLLKRFHEAKYAGGPVSPQTLAGLHRDIKQLIEGKKVVGPV